jgi:adenosyl cobinamide kinase/adenosyl cobinamide phosphate guanylyltransferase
VIEESEEIAQNADEAEESYKAAKRQVALAKEVAEESREAYINLLDKAGNELTEEMQQLMNDITAAKTAEEAVDILIRMFETN